MSGAAVATNAHSSRDDEGRRKGSALSDKQISRAAVYGRQITCRWLTAPTVHEVTGYTVGMDDYHWMVATVVPKDLRDPEAGPLTLTLVHKSGVSMIVLHPTATIGAEDHEAQDALRHVGAAYWRYCETVYGH